MEVRKLDWDSAFFGLRIGRADVHTAADAAELASRHNEWQEQFDLLYVFGREGVRFAASGAELVDEKVVYSKRCEPKECYSDVTTYEASMPNEALYRLALVSGEYSRFRLDKHFPAESYERMYRKWIENACPQPGSNKQIYVSIVDGKMQGMITVDYSGEQAKIGLVAVDPTCQHLGVGSKIMSTLEGALYRKGVCTIDVATQRANTEARRWYEKNGYTVASITPIYHWWL